MGSLSTPSPLVIDAHLADIEKAIPDVRQSYRWLAPSGSTRARRETNERTRRGVSGVSGDLGNVVVGTEAARRHLEDAAKAVARARSELLGAQAALGKAAAAIDRGTVSTISDDPLKADPPSRSQFAELHAARERRLERWRNRVTPWAADEVTG